jgi:signal transduction histidine kinase
MLRLTLATRLGLIAIVGFSAIAIILIGIFYLTTVRENEDARPSPGRLAALAELIERTAPETRQLTLAAVSSPQFTARVDVSPGPDPSANPVEKAVRARYAAALVGRHVAVAEAPGRQRFPRLSKWMANALEFRIGLRTGETLVVDTSTRLPVTRLGLPVGFGAGLFGTIVALVALLVMQRETRPLARLAAAVDRVDLSADPPLLPDARRSAPEIRAVIGAFNRLQRRLSEMLRARMTLIGGIAHDVRTFATRLRLRVERIPDPAERARAVADIDDMIRLLDDALLSSRAGAGGLTQEMVEFSVLVRTDIDDRRAQGEAVDLTLETPGQEAIVLGDRVALRRIVANIIDNAIKYGRVAHVRITVRDRTVVISVDDEGPGIPGDQRDAMLEPFNRLEASRNRVTGGAGLGLAVVRNLVEAHGGTIEIGETERGGARVMVEFPLFRVN